MTLIANRPSVGDYGRVAEGQRFEVLDPSIADELVTSGIAREAYEVTCDTEEVLPVDGDPFRYGVVYHEESTALAAEGDSVLPSADVQARRDADRGKRRRRKQSSAKG